MIKFQQEGATLLELMIVVAIIGILAAFAIPTYFDYIKKAKVAEASVLFDGFKTKVSMLYAMKGTYPTFNELKADGVVYQGTFVLGDYSDAAAAVGTPQVCFTVMGFEAGMDSIGWMYTSDPLDPSMKVWSCKASDSICTTMENKYLPLHCRP